MKQFNLCPLEVRRELADLAFLSWLINGSLDCPDLLAMINFRIPRTTRSTELFVRKYYRTNYLKNGPMARLHRVGNCVPAELDLNGCPYLWIERNEDNQAVQTLCYTIHHLLQLNITLPHPLTKLPLPLL
ncbi:Scm-like protein with four mbt domains [Homalodisca vitripennis]|nr:Scm-like protein with four mbt domains [Homalodisca vitripennis]